MYYPLWLIRSGEWCLVSCMMNKDNMIFTCAMLWPYQQYNWYDIFQVYLIILVGPFHQLVGRIYMYVVNAGIGGSNLARNAVCMLNNAVTNTYKPSYRCPNLNQTKQSNNNQCLKNPARNPWTILKSRPLPTKVKTIRQKKPIVCLICLSPGFRIYTVWPCAKTW